MMEPIEPIGAAEPAEWFVVFHPDASSRWLSALAMGHFKHVSAFTYVPVGDCWLFLDAEWTGLRIVHASHGVARRQIARYAAHCSIVKCRRADAPMRLGAAPASPASLPSSNSFASRHGHCGLTRSIAICSPTEASCSMGEPKIPVDPMLAQEQAQAQNSLVNRPPDADAGDMASLMARYGTQLALAGGMTSPLVSTRLAESARQRPPDLWQRSQNARS